MDRARITSEISPRDTDGREDDQLAVAIAAVLCGAVIFSLGDVLVKLMSVDLSLWQMLVLRAAIVVPALICLCRFRRNPVRLRPVNMRWTSVRNLLMILMWVSYYGSILVLPVAVAASIYYTMPILVTLIAAVVLGQRVGPLGWAGVCVGFVGVLLIVKPDNADFTLYTMLPFASALFFAIAIIITRTKIRREDPFVMAINLQLGFLLVGLAATGLIYGFGGISGTSLKAFLGGPWQSLGQSEWLMIVLLAVIITAGNICTAIAYQRGSSVTVATFSFAYIPFVAVWGFLLFDEVPDLRTIMGILMIVGAGLVSIRAS